jgi:hypothetical protein
MSTVKELCAQKQEQNMIPVEALHYIYVSLWHYQHHILLKVIKNKRPIKENSILIKFYFSKLNFGTL